MISNRPIGVTALARSKVGRLPHVSVAYVMRILPSEKLAKLIAPRRPMRYGSSQRRSS